MTDAAIPVGGTTGLSQAHSAAVEEAAAWLSSVPSARRPRPIVPHLKARFGLSAQEAVEALREGNLRLARAI